LLFSTQAYDRRPVAALGSALGLAQPRLVSRVSLYCVARLKDFASDHVKRACHAAVQGRRAQWQCGGERVVCLPSPVTCAAQKHRRMLSVAVRLLRRLLEDEQLDLSLLPLPLGHCCAGASQARCALPRGIAIRIRRNPWESVVIRGTQWESEAIRGNQRQSPGWNN
jgi:hypothetical protein